MHLTIVFCMNTALSCPKNRIIKPAITHSPFYHITHILVNSKQNRSRYQQQRALKAGVEKKSTQPQNNACASQKAITCLD